jgi:hypothetical protein
MIPIKNLDICKSTEKYILQQCNCITVTSLGVAKVLATHFSHGDAYKDRRRLGQRNYTIPEDRSIPGTVTILDGEDHLPSIICLYGQFRPGSTRPTYYYPKDYPDCISDRLRYFQEGLDGLLEYFGEDCPFISVPFMIGCGLAKGNWKKYLDLLNNFHYQLQQYGGGLVFYKI